MDARTLPPVAALLLLVACCGTGDAGDAVGTDTGADTDETDGSGAPDCVEAGPGLVIGTGTNAYEPLADGDDVSLVYGPQGGWHVEVGGLVSGSSEVITVAPRVVWIAEDRQLGGEQEAPIVQLAAYDDATCTGEFYGNYAFLDEYFPDESTVAAKEAFICSLDGEQLEISVTVTDFTTGLSTTATRLVTARPDPNTNDCP